MIFRPFKKYFIHIEPMSGRIRKAVRKGYPLTIERITPQAWLERRTAKISRPALNLLSYGAAEGFLSHQQETKKSRISIWLFRDEDATETTYCDLLRPLGDYTEIQKHKKTTSRTRNAKQQPWSAQPTKINSFRDHH